MKENLLNQDEVISEKLTDNQEKILDIIEIYHPYSEITTRLLGDNLVICEFPYDCADEEWSYDAKENIYYCESREIRQGLEVFSQTKIRPYTAFDYDKLDEIINSLAYLKRSKIIDKSKLKEIIVKMMEKYKEHFNISTYDPSTLDEFPEVSRIIEEILYC